MELRRIELVISRSKSDSRQVRVTGRLFADTSSMVHGHVYKSIIMPGPVELEVTALADLHRAIMDELARWSGRVIHTSYAPQDALPF